MAYTNPTIVANEPQTDGTLRLVLKFSGNAGEPDVIKDFIVKSSTTPTILRNWIDATMVELDKIRTAATIPGLQVGQTITRLAPTPATPSPKSVWQTKLNQYLQAKGYGITAADADLAAMKADLEATYQTGFLT